MKAMEDLKVNYDLSVRNADGNIIQFLYGEDGMDYIKIMNQKSLKNISICRCPEYKQNTLETQRKLLK